MQKSIIAIFISIIVFIISTPTLAIRDYKPLSTNPLYEYWRWRHYPEMNTKGVRCMVETSEGEMWFGVDKGVMRYDGLDWTLYTPSDGLRGTPVNIMKVFDDGSIYAGSESGLSRFDGEKWHPIFPHDTSLTFSVRSICEMPDGAILCGLDKGLIYFKNNQCVFYTSQTLGNHLADSMPSVRFIPVNAQYLIHESFWVDEIFIDNNNLLWLAIGYENGLSGKLINATYNSSNPVPLRFKLRLAEPEAKQFYNGIKITQTSDERVWIITQQHDHGLRYFEKDKETYFRLSDYFGGDNIFCSIIQTEDGTIWIGGLGRLMAYKNNQWFQYRSPEVPVPPSNRILLLEARDGSIWIAGKRNEVFQLDYTKATWMTYKGLNFACVDQDGREWFLAAENRVVCYDADRWYSYGTEDGLMDHPEVIFITRSGRLWTGGSQKGTSATAYFDGNSWHLQSYPNLSWNIDFRGIFEDRDNQLWIAGAVDIQPQKGHIGGILKFPDPENDPGNFIHYTLPQTEFGVYGIGQTKDGRMWVAGINGCWFDGETWRIISNPPELRNHSDAIYTSSSGEVWYGSRNYGVFRFNGEEWQQYTVEDGLLSNSIKSIYVESDSSVWVATDKDICRFDSRTWTTGIFPDALTILHEGGDLKPGKTGQIWINKTSRKWHRRVLDQVGHEVNEDVWTVRFSRDHAPPETRITMFDPKVYQPGNTIISWCGIDRWKNTPDEQIQYSYRMDNNEWSNFSKNTSHIFLELTTGAHTFKVRARDRDFNIDPTPVEVQLNVELPFYLQPAFLIPVILLTILSVFLEIRVIGKNKKLQTAKKETDNILQNVEEGLFLINPAYEIGNQYSRALEKIFEQDNLGQINFIDLIRDKINEQNVETATDYLDVAFNIDTPSTVLDDLNPMHEIKLDFGKNRIKFLNFKFSKIDTGTGNTDHLIATVNDITQEKRLAEELKESQEKSERQMNWLLTLLQVDPKLLREFLLEVQNELNAVRDLLLKEKDPEKFPEMLKKIYRSIHMIKGNASMLTLNFFTDQAHALEDRITELQKQGDTVTITDLKILNEGINEIQVSIDTASGLLERISQIHSQMRLKRSHENKIILQSFQNLVNQLGSDTGKNIDLKTKKFSLNDIPYEKQFLVKDIMVQLLRNAIAHGIETVEERKAAGKSSSGVIEISSFKNKNEFGFSVRDDGRGLQLNRLRERAQRLGKWSKKDIDGWKEDQIISTIFISGISTSENADVLSGRGVGLDLVREKLEKVEGTILVDFKQGHYCEFAVHIPC